MYPMLAPVSNRRLEPYREHAVRAAKLWTGVLQGEHPCSPLPLLLLSVRRTVRSLAAAPREDCNMRTRLRSGVHTCSSHVISHQNGSRHELTCRSWPPAAPLAGTRDGFKTKTCWAAHADEPAQESLSTRSVTGEEPARRASTDALWLLFAHAELTRVDHQQRRSLQPLGTA